MGLHNISRDELTDEDIIPDTYLKAHRYLEDNYSFNGSAVYILEMFLDGQVDRDEVETHLFAVISRDREFQRSFLGRTAAWSCEDETLIRNEIAKIISDLSKKGC